MKKLVTLVVAALLLGVATGCGSTGESDAQTPPKKDSGVAWCERLAATAAAGGGKGAAPTDDEIEEAKDAWEDSDLSDLRRAGLAHLAAVKAYYDDPEKADVGDVLIKRQSLEATCAKHGVTIARPSITPPAMPSYVPVPTLPTNPYEN